MRKESRGLVVRGLPGERGDADTVPRSVGLSSGQPDGFGVDSAQRKLGHLNLGAKGCFQLLAHNLQSLLSRGGEM